MNQNNTTLSIALLIALLVGGLAGYAIGGKNDNGRTMMDIRGGRWAEKSSGMMGSGMMDEDDMQGMMRGMMNGLSGKKGADLEKAFLDEMIVHHEGAVAMAKTLLAGTQRPELVKMANDIISAQTTEIQMMKEWRSSWF